jgi:type IV secretory pathway VirD2 relaxase
LERDSATRPGEPEAGAFGPSTQDVSLPNLLTKWQENGDGFIWKFIISPEFGERVELQRLTRELMGQIESDLGKPIEWGAIAHFNTEHPHVHVALRGISSDGQELRLSRDYIKRGIRDIAQDACTRQLGFRTSLDAAEAERREIGESRLTSLDRQIFTIATPDPERPENRLLVEIEQRHVLSGARQRKLMARMAVLKRMGLAEEIGPSTWMLRSDAEHVLRTMRLATDRQRTLARHRALLSDDRLGFEVLDWKRMASVEGRIVGHDEDEYSGRGYLLLESTNAKIYFVARTFEMEDIRSRGGLRINSFVQLRRDLAYDRESVKIEDFGHSERILTNRALMNERARSLLQLGIEPTEEGWGGWLGRYQAALKKAADGLAAKKERDGDEQRTRTRSRAMSR